MRCWPYLKQVISGAIAAGRSYHSSLTETHGIAGTPRPPPFVTQTNHRLFVAGGFDRLVPNLIEEENNALQ